MSLFIQKLYSEILNSIENNYSDNFDERRFGIAPEKKVIIGKREKVKEIIFRNPLAKLILFPLLNELKYAEQKNLDLLSGTISRYNLKDIIREIQMIITDYGEKLNKLYENLSDRESKELLVKLMAYHILGNKFVKLRTNSPYYWSSLSEIENIADQNDFIDPEFLHFMLHKYDLRKFGKNISLYYTSIGILTDFFLEQYSYKGTNKIIEAVDGNTVIDAGGCWGDTALYFSEKVKEKGKVFCFEFVPKNKKILERNLELNPHLSKIVTVISNPVWDVSGKDIFFVDNGPGTHVSFEKIGGAVEVTKTISIDDFVAEKKLSAVDFIKMDIEGAERYALNGAVNTIKKFKPNLAISVYHSMDDLVDIPIWIINLNLGYKIYLGHYTIHKEETVIFATAND